MSERAKAKVKYDQSEKAKGMKQVRDLKKKIDILATGLILGAWDKIPQPHKVKDLYADQATWDKLVNQETKLLKRMRAAKSEKARKKASGVTLKEHPQLVAPTTVAPPTVPRPTQSRPMSRAKSRQSQKHASKVGTKDSTSSSPEPEPKIKIEPDLPHTDQEPELPLDNKAQEHEKDSIGPLSQDAAGKAGTITETADGKESEQLAQHVAEKPDSKGKAKAANESISRSSASTSGDRKSEAEAEGNKSDSAQQIPHKSKEAHSKIVPQSEKPDKSLKVVSNPFKSEEGHSDWDLL